MQNNTVKRETSSLAAQRITRPVLNIFIGTKASYAGLWIAKYELPFLNRADQERVGSLYLDLEPLSDEIDRAHYDTNDASPMIKQTLRFPDLSQYVTSLSEEQKHWLQITSPAGVRLPEYTRMGAGGIRQNGFGAVWYNSPIVAQHIEALINNICAVDSAGHAPDADLITINIVCFLGGGTGSGSLPAIAALARHTLRSQRRGGNIFVFGVLPVNVGNIAPERQILQKSNSLAAVLELEALMMKGDDKSQSFMIDMGNMQIRTSGGLVDEIFLFDDTQLGDQIEQISQLIGMAISMRMQNLTGIGKREQSLRPDLTALQERDDSGMLTNIGSICPLEVVYPAAELAIGFARRKAQQALLQLLNAEPMDYHEEDIIRNQLCPARRAMELFHISDRERRAAPDPRRWGGSEIMQSIDRYSTVVEHTFNEQRDAAVKDHLAALDALCANPSFNKSLARLQNALEIFSAEYKKVKELTFAGAPVMQRMGPDMLAAENERKRKAYYQQACQEEFQKHRINATNSLADLVIEDIDKRLRMLEVMQSTLRFTQQRWEADHYDAPEMRGLLTQEHPYRRNVFDHSALREANDIDELDTAVSAGETDRILRKASAAMASALTGDEREARQTAAAEANQIMEDMTQAYHNKLSSSRLLEAIQLIYPRDRDQQDAALANHFRWMSVTARSTLRHDPSLWGDQAHRQLEVRAHVAADYSGEHERQWVERTRASVGGFGERGPGYTPTGEFMASNDPYRMQLLFSHHGVSLSAAPYLSDAAGGCVKALRDRQKMWETQGGIPVFTCDALQEIITNPNEFSDPLTERAQANAASGAPVPEQRNLIDRIERRAIN